MDDDKEQCEWCEEEYESSELKETNIGKLCPRCIDAILSRGEELWIKH